LGRYQKVAERIKSLNPSKDKKIIVFVGFIKTGEKLLEILQNEDIKSGFFYGELEEAKREKLIDKLWNKEEDRIDVFVSTDAAYVGLNLQIADTMIHHDLSWNPMVVEQRVGRIHRIGQRREITSYSFLCKDTIDKRKHEILTGKLEEISTHLGMSYSVILSEVAISSEIEKLMVQFELKEIDEEMLKEGLKKHITERREIFELLEELPSEEVEILQIGFTNELIEKVEEIIGEIVKLGRKTLDFRIQPIIEGQDFIILDYEKDGKRIKELSTLNEKALLSVKPEEVQVWKEKYKFENLNPSYLGPFHPLVKETANLLIEKNSGKFWKKKIANSKPVVSLYLLVPLKIKNFTAEIDTEMEILTPILYEIDKKEITLNTIKTYELMHCSGKIDDSDDGDMGILKEAKEELDRKMNDIKSKIRADIEKVRVEIEELALQKQRQETERKTKEKMKKLENLNREINQKRNSGLRYEKEMQEAKKLKEELDELQKMLETVPESSLTIEFEEPQIAGGCIYVS